MRAIESRIGISTHVLPGVSLDEAINAVARAGFRAFELVPADWQCVVGHPRMIRNAGVWPRTFGKTERAALRKQLEVFEIVTVHSPHLGGLNIAAINPGIREESRRQDRELIEFAADIGAASVTFHPGNVVQDSCHGWEDDFHRLNIEFARELAELAEKFDLPVGFETAEGDPNVGDIVDRVGRDHFGMHLDVCNSYAWEIFPKLRNPDAAHAELERVIGRYGPRLTEVHVHGAFHWWGGVLTHQSFQRNNVIDWPRILRKLKEAGYAGPLILEIQSIDLAAVLQDARSAKDLLIAAWG